MAPKKAANSKSNPGKKGGGSVHKLADPLPEGEIITDLTKGQWRLGKPIGSGGFGVIYLASRVDNPKKSYVMKLEPHGNGPLFCELAFYQRAAKPDAVADWQAMRRLSFVGVPRYIASGIHEKNSQRYRMMVMERFGDDLQKLFEQNNKQFPVKTVFTVATIVMNALEYIHEKEYVHADIKASNLLRGYDSANEVYLVDYGLAFRYRVADKHTDYKEDPRKVHDGTIEFTSCDAHKGVSPSRRGDLEILGYCLLQWLCGRLPWERNLANKEFVRDEKIKYMKNIPKLMIDCFHGHSFPGELQRYFEYVEQLEYDEKPDYDTCRKLFHNAIVHSGAVDDGRLVFTTPAARQSNVVRSPAKKSTAGGSVNKTPSKKPAAAAKSPMPPKIGTSRKRQAADDCTDDEDEVEEIDDDSDEDYCENGCNTPPSKVKTKPQTTAHNKLQPNSTNNHTFKSPPGLSAASLTPAAVLSPAKPSTGRARPRNGRAAEIVSYASAGTQTSPGLAGLRPKKKAVK